MSGLLNNCMFPRQLHQLVATPHVLQVTVGESASTSTSGDVVTLSPLPVQQAAVVGHGGLSNAAPQASH